MISNEYEMNYNDSRLSSYEYFLWGNPGIRFLFLMSVCILIILIVSLITSSGKHFILLCIAVVVVINLAIIIKAIYASNRVAERCENRERRICLVIENEEIVHKVFEEEKEIDSRIYELKNARGLYCVKDYSFLIMNDKSILILKNDSFKNGSLKELKQLINDIKKDKK